MSEKYVNSSLALSWEDERWWGKKVQIILFLIHNFLIKPRRVSMTVKIVQHEKKNFL